jgi:hypothetical protein
MGRTLIESERYYKCKPKVSPAGGDLEGAAHGKRYQGTVKKGQENRDQNPRVK